jgi:hypothetical protein
MGREVLRLSQLVGVFGPGAMLDLPERSVIVGGLNHWDMGGRHAFKVIEEERLSRLLEQFLRKDGHDDGRVAEGRPLQLRTPPVEPGFGQARQGNGGAPPAGVRVAVLPTVFTCDTPDAAPPGQPGIRRRMVRWQDLDPSHQRRRYVDDAGKKHEVTPIRFVCGCQSGHLQDIDWRWITHGDGARACHEPMWLEETGTSGEPSATRVACGCGKALSLDELFQPGRLGMCRGERPWIGDRDPAGCDLPLRLLTRSATNTYFPQVVVVISLPEADDELTRRVREHLSVLRNAAGPEQVGMARMFNPALGEALKGYDDGEIFARLQRLLAQGDAEALADPREAEFELLASGHRAIGENRPDALLHAETLDRDTWDKGREAWLAPIASLVKVHRLREVVCLYGFTRFEAAALASDAGLEDVGLAVSGAPLGPEPAWLPAVEQFGEGLFLSFEAAALKAWLGRRAVREHAAKLEAGVRAWEKAKGEGRARARTHLHHGPRPVARADDRDRARLRLPRQRAARARVRLAGDARQGGPVRVTDLHRHRWHAGHAGRPGRGRRPVPARARGGPGAAAALLGRPRLRRPRTGNRHRGSRPARRGLPRLPADGGDELRDAEPLSRPRLARRHRGRF